MVGLLGADDVRGDVIALPVSLGGDVICACLMALLDIGSYIILCIYYRLCPLV